jgi:hypothetical protein
MNQALYAHMNKKKEEGFRSKVLKNCKEQVLKESR